MAEGYCPSGYDITDFAMIRFAIILFVLSLPPIAWAQGTLITNANKAAEEFRQSLESVAVWCDRRGLKEEAAFARSAILPQYPDRMCIPKFPLEQGTLALEKGIPKSLPRDCVAYVTGADDERPEGKTWTDAQMARSYLVSLREKYAKDLSMMAKVACRQARGTLATQLAMAALHANPDHPQLRAAFGFVKYKNQWRTPWEVKMLKDGYVDHPRFGWLPKSHLEKYEAGQRYYKDRWISAEEDARLHANYKNGWVIESEHYLIATTHSIEEGVRLRNQLEHFYRAWKMIFYRYAATDEELASYFSGKVTPKIPAYRHKIVVYRDRAEFMRETRSDAGGFYYTGDKCCHFYAHGPDQSDREKNATLGTMYHEATHQLFSEIEGQVKWGGSKQNYWIIEGVAVFMESFRQQDGFYTVGNRNAWRVEQARQLWREKKIGLSMSEMLDVNSAVWKKFMDDEAINLYSQVAGIFQFLMFADGGRYRDPLIVYLQQVYDDKDTPRTFQQLLKLMPEEFDEKYRQSMDARE